MPAPVPPDPSFGRARSAPGAPYSAHDRERFVPEDRRNKRSDRDDFARDRGRIIHSAGLRRLSAKTQVMEPGSDDFVRNRLTHSLEVAQIGRELGAALGCNADVVDSACLAHDLGHPPFGHNGESALDELAAAAGGFEGNAQTFRLLTRLEAKRAGAGLNLTRATLDATAKYPWAKGAGPDPESAKYGVYASDRPIFDWVREGRASGDSSRCLEAEVMDWADDVAYSVHDVEDAVAGGLLDLRVLGESAHSGEIADVVKVARLWYVPDLDDETLHEARERLVAREPMIRQFTCDGSRDALAALKDLTSRLVGYFVAAAEDATRAAHGSEPLVRHEARLVVPDEARAECAVLKALAAHFVMLDPDRLSHRAREREIVADLVEAYHRDASRLDPPYLADLRSAEADGDADAALRAVIDQVASLSDVRALQLHARWS